MKINSAMINKTYGNNVKKDVKSVTKNSVKAENVDKIEVSHKYNKPASVNEMTNKAVNELNSEFETQRLMEIKKAVQSGEYQVDHEKLAQAMINYANIVKGV